MLIPLENIFDNNEVLKTLLLNTQQQEDVEDFNIGTDEEIRMWKFQYQYKTYDTNIIEQGPFKKRSQTIPTEIKKNKSNFSSNRWEGT